MKFNERSKIRERRKRRMFIPTFYFIVEMTLAWLVISIIQVSFDFRTWSVWSVIVMFVFMLYSLIKTVHIYKRQKDYES